MLGLLLVHLLAYGAFSAFGVPHALDNFIRLQTTYFKRMLVNS